MIIIRRTGRFKSCSDSHFFVHIKIVLLCDKRNSSRSDIGFVFSVADIFADFVIVVIFSVSTDFVCFSAAD